MLSNQRVKMMKSKWYEFPGRIIGTLLTVPPLGITMMWIHNTWNKVIKIIVSILAGIYTLFWGVTIAFGFPVIDILVAILFLIIALSPVKIKKQIPDVPVLTVKPNEKPQISNNANQPTNTQIHKNQNISFSCNFTVFDVETTGLTAGIDKIIEISAIRYRCGKEADRFSTLVNPEIHIPSSSTRVNHISDSMVSEAPVIDKVIPKFIEFIGTDDLVGHNVKFDIKFVQAALNRPLQNKAIDTLSLSRKCIASVPNYKLETLKGFLNINATSHRSLDDCKTTAALYMYCLNHGGKANYITTPEITCTSQDHSKPYIKSLKEINKDNQPLTRMQKIYYDAIINLLQENGKPVEHIQHSQTSTYFDICSCHYYPFVRLKLQGNLRYWLVRMSPEKFSEVAIADEEYKPASKSEGPMYTRVFITSPENLCKYKDIILNCFDEAEKQRINYEKYYSYS